MDTIVFGLSSDIDKPAGKSAEGFVSIPEEEYQAMVDIIEDCGIDLEEAIRLKLEG